MLSICISVKNRSRVQAEGRELRLFPDCIQAIVASVRPEDEAELVVADWHSDDWPLAEWLPEAAKPIPHSIIPADGVFSRGRGRNVAADHARGDVLLFLDADVIVVREVIEDGLHQVRAGRAYFPEYYKHGDPDGHTRIWVNGSFGNVMIARDVFLRTGKWPEFGSWGAEDNQFYEAVWRLVPICRPRPAGFHHPWHPDSLEWKDRYADASCRGVTGAR